MRSRKGMRGDPSTPDGAGQRNFSLDEAARRLGISRHTLRTWACSQHRLPFYRLGRRLLFAAADLEAFLAAHRVEARGETSR
jgi:excisionase family DNA binding protein